MSKRGFQNRDEEIVKLRRERMAKEAPAETSPIDDGYESNFGEFKESGGSANNRAASAAIESVGSSSGGSGIGRAGEGIMAYGAAAKDPTAVGIGATLSTLDAINQSKKRKGEQRQLKKLQRIQMQQQALSNLTSVHNNLRRL